MGLLESEAGMLSDVTDAGQEICRTVDLTSSGVPTVIPPAFRWNWGEWGMPNGVACGYEPRALRATLAGFWVAFSTDPRVARHSLRLALFYTGLT